MIRFALLLLLVGAWIAPAEAMDEAELEALLAEAREEMNMPGLRAAVQFADDRVVLAATGLADREADVPLDNRIGMPGGSTGKMYVAALTMLLVEDGVLSLDDKASKWLGDEQWFVRLANHQDIKVRHLLSHSSGLGDYPATSGFNTVMIWRVIRRGAARFTPEELIDFVTGRNPKFDAGDGYAYTDAGYLVLGKLIEAVSGRSYFDLLAERILIPQQQIDVHPQNRSPMPGITPGYMGGGRNLNKKGLMKLEPVSEWTGGGLVTTPAMLAGFAAALADGKIVRADTLGQMISGGWQDPDTPRFHYGFGMFVYDNGASWGHGGLWPGYRTHVAHYSASGITIAVQTNRDGRVDLQGLVETLHAAALREDG